MASTSTSTSTKLWNYKLPEGVEPAVGREVALLYSNGQRIIGTVLVVFDDDDEISGRGMTVRIREHGEKGEDVWEAPIANCRLEGRSRR